MGRFHLRKYCYLVLWACLLYTSGRGLWDILGAVASAVLWPVRAVGGILFGGWDVSSQWTPLYFVACGVLLAALVFLLACALWVNHRRKKGK